LLWRHLTFSGFFILLVFDVLFFVVSEIVPDVGRRRNERADRGVLHYLVGAVLPLRSEDWILVGGSIAANAVEGF
jgi:hypothetical protein